MRAFAVVFVLLVLCLPASAGVAPSVSVSPEVIPPGGELTVKGRGWPADSRVGILVGRPRSEATRIGTLRTTARGRFKGTVKFSESADKGRYVLLACRRKCAIKAKAKFTIADSVGGR